MNILSINRARLFFSTALPACVTAAALAALRLLRQKPEQYVGRLKENAAFMRRLLHDEGFEIINGVTPIVPVLTGSSEKPCGLWRRFWRQALWFRAYARRRCRKGQAACV